MSESKVRQLMIKRHPRLRGCLLICDEETGLPLAGQREVNINSSILDGKAMVTVTFEAFGGEGVRLSGDEPREEFWKPR